MRKRREKGKKSEKGEKEESGNKHAWARIGDFCSNSRLFIQQMPI